MPWPFLVVMRCDVTTRFGTSFSLGVACALLVCSTAVGTAKAQSETAEPAEPSPPTQDASPQQPSAGPDQPAPPAEVAPAPAEQPASPAEPAPAPSAEAPPEIPGSPAPVEPAVETAAPELPLPAAPAEAPPGPVAAFPAPGPEPETPHVVSFPNSDAAYAPNPPPELDRAPESDESKDRDDGPLNYGLMVDIAAPDGLMGSVVFRPFWWLRTHAGAGTNSISGGVRLGLSLIPFGAGPSLTLDGGHYFEGDANSLAQNTLGIGADSGSVLDRVGYDFANAHLGIEFGQDRVAFFIHGGLSYVRTTVYNSNSLIGPPQVTGAETTTITINQDPTLVAIVPSAKFGLVAYIL